MMWSLLDDNDSIFAEMRMQAEEDWGIPTVPEYRAPQYVPSHHYYQDNDRGPQWQHAEERSTPSYRRPDYVPSAYDYQSNAQPSRGNSDRHTARDSGPQRAFSYGPQRASSYGPRRAFSYGPQRSSSYVPRNHAYTWPSSSNADRGPYSGDRYWTTESSQPSYSSSPPSYTFYSSSDSYPTNSSYSFRPGAPPRTSYVPPSSTPPSYQRPVTPPPQGIKPTTDLYTVLGVGRTATAADIKKAHRAMSLKWHPDRCRGQDKKKTTEKMAEINQAKDVLSDEVKRKFYDRWGVLPSEV